MTWCFGLLANGQLPALRVSPTWHTNTPTWGTRPLQRTTARLRTRVGYCVLPKQAFSPLPTGIYAFVQYFNFDKPHSVHFIYT